MGEHSWSTADVLCPFYIGDEAKSKTVRCEGYIDGLRVQLQFRRRDQQQNYMGRHCCGAYQRCEVYKATMKKYPTDF